MGNIKIGSNVEIHSRCLIECLSEGKCIIKNNVSINVDSRITSINEVTIEENVMFGPGVYIADGGHEYSNISLPIKNQQMNSEGKISIGNGSWLGRHSAIIGNVSIGKGCVVAANAVVTKSIPDYCVVAGCPARIIKKYNMNTEVWEKVN